jgi:hypothetical protein
MFSWVRLVHIGDAKILIPVAVAITIFLLLNRAWRLTLWWTVLFWASLALVLASKIAFIGWGLGIEKIDYKAVSGHAMLTAAVLPVMFHLILRQRRGVSEHAGEFLGFALAISVSVCLVAFDFHAPSEAIFGSILGSSVSLVFLRLAEASSATFRMNRWIIPVSVATFLLLHYARLIPTQYWMTRIALYLSGHDLPYSWHTWQRSI